MLAGSGEFSLTQSNVPAAEWYTSAMRSVGLVGLMPVEGDFGHLSHGRRDGL